ncbi:MAG: hypothetical protein SGILL_001832 [Bacillariaceae sp.]
MICSNFVVRGLESAYQKSEKDESVSAAADDDDSTRISLSKTPFPKLHLSVNQVEATCHGRYHATGGIAGDVQAHVVEQQQQQHGRWTDEGDDQDASKPKALNVAFGLRPKSKSHIKQPSKCTAEACATHLTCQSIHFSGSTSAKLIQAFSKVISKYITDALQEFICPKIIQQQAIDLVTRFLQHPFHEFVSKYLPEEGGEMATAAAALTPVISKTSNDTSSTVKNVFDYSTVRWGLTTFNAILRNHLQDGWIPLPPVDDTLEMLGDGLVSTVIQLSSPIAATNQHRQLPPDCVDMFRGISGWIKAIFGVRPRINLPSYFHQMVLPISIQKSIVTLDISHVAIEGLDQMESLQLLQPPKMSHRKSNRNNNSDSDPNLLQTNVTSPAGFYLVAPVVLNVTMPSKDPLVEQFQVSLNVTRFEMTLATALQVQNWDSTTMLQIVNAIQKFTDSFSKHHHGEPDWKALACLVRTVDKVELSDWITNVIVDSLQVSRDKSGALEADLDATINTALLLVVQEYRVLWSILVKGLVQDLGTTKLNGFLRQWIKEHSFNDAEVCPSPTPYENRDSPKWINFTKFELFNKLNRFFDNEKHMKTINHFLRCVGESVELWSEWDFLSSTIVSGEAHHSNYGQEQVSIASLDTDHWDSLKSLELLHPSGDKTLASSFLFGNPSNGAPTWRSGSAPPQATVVVDLEGPKVSGRINLTVFLDLEANAEIELYYDLNRLENLTVDHLLAQEACGMLPLVDMRILSNRTYLEIGERAGLNLTGFVNGKHVALSSNSIPRIRWVGNEVLALSLEWIRDVANKAVTEFAGLSFETCPGVVAPEDNNGSDAGNSSWRVPPFMWCLVLLIVVLQAGLFWISHSEPIIAEEQFESQHVVESAFDESMLSVPPTTPSFLSSFKELISPLAGSPSKTSAMRRVDTPNSLDRSVLGEVYEQMNEDYRPLHMTLEEQLFLGEDEEEPTKSMFESNALPRCIPYSVPALIVATTILLITSNASVGASVDLSIRVDETSLAVPSIFRFSFGNTVRELYHAGIYPLLLLVVCFSGVWPYVKLCWMLYAWMVPCEDEYQRERRLLQLDALGKFSLVDSYVLILFVVAFRFHLEFSERFGIEIFVTPMYGFYSFLFATCLSLVLGHSTVFFHRSSKETRAVGNTDTAGEESVLQHTFEGEDGQSPRRLARIPQALYLCFVLSAMVLLILGFVQESFTFKIGGLAGIALGDDYNGSTYSVVSLGAAIPESLENPTAFDIFFLQGTYFFFTVVTPIMCLTSLLLLLVWPLASKRQKCLLVIVEMTNAWSAIEVFLLSIVAAVLQISAFAEFLIGDKCNGIDSLASTILDGEDFEQHCFTVDASVDSNCWYLVAGALLNSCMVSVSLRFIHAAVEERSAGNPSELEENFLSRPHQHVPRNHGFKMVQELMGLPLIGWLLFTSVELSVEDTIALIEEDVNGNDEDELAEQPGVE